MSTKTDSNPAPKVDWSIPAEKVNGSVPKMENPPPPPPSQPDVAKTK